MKLDLALRELHRSEKSLAGEFIRASDRHKVEHEVHHVARDLAGWSREHIHALAAIGRRYGLRLADDPPRLGGPLGQLRGTVSDLTGRRAAPGLLLLADLRRLHRKAAGVSLDWELLTQGAQGAKDSELLELAMRCHPRTLRQLKWTNTMLKTLSPQILAN